LSYSSRQYLYQNPVNPQQGWGIFGQVGVSDGNPNPIEASFMGGLAGSSVVSGRSDDRWGVGYFRYNLSRGLLGGLDTIGIHLRDEQGIEAFYNFAVTPWFRITADVQHIQPVRKDRDDATFLGLRT
jgi:porin